MKYQIIRQYSEEDCGAACLATIIKHYQKTLTLNRIREAVGTGQLGTTLLGLRQGAESLGFNARAVKASNEVFHCLERVTLPAIIHWKGEHWVVLYGQKGKKYIIADPAVDIRYLSRQELVDSWEGRVMLLLEPDLKRFNAQPDDEIGGFNRFLVRALNYRSVLSEAFICSLAVGLLSLASPFLIEILTDDVLVRGDTQLLKGIAIAVIVMNLLSSGIQWVQYNLIAHFAQRLHLNLVLEFGRQILRLPLTYYESRRSGEIVSRLEDIQEINQLVSQMVVNLPSQFAITLASLSFMVFYSWKLTLVAVFIAALMTLSTVIFLPTLQQKIRSLIVLEAENQGVLVETFKGALTLKTTNAITSFWEEFQSRFGRSSNLTFRTTQISIVNNTFSGFVSSSGIVVLFWVGSSLVINQEISIGQLLAFSSMNRNFQTFISTVVGFVNQFARVKTATQRLTEVTDATPETANEDKGFSITLASNANITCTHINFHYPGRLELLENFSLHIPGGKVVALIGESGCGKSSLAKVIAGLYKNQSGNIRIGKYNLQDISLSCLRSQIVLVPQEPHFWSRSITDNFRLAFPNVSLEQIVQACCIAEADDFISKLPNKYQTTLGEFGSNISGGQRQRLAIARAIVTEPPILILDESTAGLDPISESRVLERLLSHRQGKTTILISHRPRVISRADWIVLLDRGKVKKQGSIDDLYLQAGEHLNFITP